MTSESTLQCFAYKQPLDAATLACAQRIMPFTHKPFSFEPSPYFEIPTRLSCDLAGTCRVIVKTPAQCGKSTMLENFIAWICNYDPAPTLMIMDTLKNAQNYSKTRLKPFLRDSVHLSAFQERSPDNRGEDKIKEVCSFSIGPNANLMLGGSSSASDLCSRPVKYLICDELDRWVDLISGEGDPLLLALKRMMRFRGMAIFASTPTMPDKRITQHFMLGTCETWGVVCSACKQWFGVEYDKIQWLDCPLVACPHCGTCYNEFEVKLLTHCYSSPRNDAPFRDKFGRIARSFEVAAPLCHSFYSWDDLKREEKQALQLGETAIQTFRNVTLGEAYVPPEIKRLDPLQFTAFLKEYTLQNVPSWVDKVFGGGDTQDGMLVCEVVGVSADGLHVAGLGFYTFPGDMQTPAPWQRYIQFVKTFRCTTEDKRELQIIFMFQDSGGHYTNTVYNLMLIEPRIRAVKGRSFAVDGDKEERALIERVAYRKSHVGPTECRVPLVHIGTVFGKDIVSGKMRQRLYDEKFTSWEWSRDIAMNYNAEYFAQLNSNYYVKTKYGHRYELAVGEHDEALDCRVYALAAIEYYRQWQGKNPAIQAAQEIKKEEVMGAVQKELNFKVPHAPDPDISEEAPAAPVVVRSVTPPVAPVVRSKIKFRNAM